MFLPDPFLFGDRLHGLQQRGETSRERDAGNVSSLYSNRQVTSQVTSQEGVGVDESQLGLAGNRVSSRGGDVGGNNRGVGGHGGGGATGGHGGGGATAGDGAGVASDSVGVPTTLDSYMTVYCVSLISRHQYQLEKGLKTVDSFVTMTDEQAQKQTRYSQRLYNLTKFKENSLLKLEV